MKALADALIAAGVSVWYDEYEMKIGDSLIARINEGLLNSRFGVVVLSENFFAKRWPKKELDGLTALETADGAARILPIWHGLNHAQVAARSPILAGLLAADTSRDSIPSIVTKISAVL